MGQVWGEDNPLQELKMRVMGAIFDTIRDKLNQAFEPTRLEIEDDSARHHGHAGARPGGESHFNVLIESAAFEGAPKVARQRMVYRALAEELAGPLHALSVRALAPGEDA
jgi:BolA protein